MWFNDLVSPPVYYVISSGKSSGVRVNFPQDAGTEGQKGRAGSVQHLHQKTPEVQDRQSSVSPPPHTQLCLVPPLRLQRVSHHTLTARLRAPKMRRICLLLKGGQKQQYRRAGDYKGEFINLWNLLPNCKRFSLYYYRMISFWSLNVCMCVCVFAAVAVERCSSVFGTTTHQLSTETPPSMRW